MDKLKKLIKEIAYNVVEGHALAGEVEFSEALEEIKGDIESFSEDVSGWCGIETLDGMDIEAAMISAVNDCIKNNDDLG